MPTERDIRAFCAYYGVQFFDSRPVEFIEGSPCFIFGSNTFPVHRVTVPVSEVEEWLRHPPYLGEGI